MREIENIKSDLKENIDDYFLEIRDKIEHLEKLNKQLSADKRNLEDSYNSILYKNTKDSEEYKDQIKHLKEENKRLLDKIEKLEKSHLQEEITIDYIRKLDFSNMGHEDFMEISTYLYRAKKLKELDFLNLTITEKKFKNPSSISGGVLEMILDSFTKELKLQFDLKNYIEAGLETLFTKILENKYGTLKEVEDFFSDDNIDIIFSIINNNIDNINYLDFILRFGDLLILNIRTDLFKDYGDVLVKLINDNFNSYSDENILDILFQAIAVGESSDVYKLISLDYSNKLIELQKDYEKKMDLYKLYTKMLMKKDIDFPKIESKIKELDDMYISDNIFNYIKFNLYKERNDKLDYVLYKLNEKMGQCPKDDESLVDEKRDIIYYKSDSIVGYKKIKVRYCNKCHKSFISRKEYKKLKNEFLYEHKYKININDKYYDPNFENKDIDTMPEYDFE